MPTWKPIARYGIRVLALLALALAGGALAVPTAPPGLPPYDPDKPLSEKERQLRLDRLEPNLTPEAVQALIGLPRRVARQVLYHRSLDQWVYDNPFQVRLEFDCPRGQEPRLLSVQLLNAGKP